MDEMSRCVTIWTIGCFVSMVALWSLPSFLAAGLLLKKTPLLARYVWFKSCNRNTRWNSRFWRCQPFRISHSSSDRYPFKSYVRNLVVEYIIYFLNARMLTSFTFRTFFAYHLNLLLQLLHQCRRGCMDSPIVSFSRDRLVSWNKLVAFEVQTNSPFCSVLWRVPARTQIFFALVPLLPRSWRGESALLIPIRTVLGVSRLVSRLVPKTISAMHKRSRPVMQFTAINSRHRQSSSLIWGSVPVLILSYSVLSRFWYLSQSL